MILRDMVPPKEVEKYLSVSRMVWAVTAVASPLMARALVDNNIGLSCFDLSVFPGMIGYVMAFFFLDLPEPSWTDPWLDFRQFDYLGTLCLTAGTACMLLVPASSGTLPP
ncbi:hypothetical protein F5883DRAFT_544050 [Diaporthe sp. PMI_573]|nr:hypothetical protein F5883DRAFT_544050 [Diaporthaceae sp. PMI_573]